MLYECLSKLRKFDSGSGVSRLYPKHSVYMHMYISVYSYIYIYGDTDEYVYSWGAIVVFTIVVITSCCSECCWDIGDT